MANTGPADPAWSTTSRCSCSNPGRSTGSDSGGTTAPTSPVLSQIRLLTFPGSIATTNVDAGSAFCSKPTTTSRPLRKHHQDAPAGTGSTAISQAAAGTAALHWPGQLGLRSTARGRLHRRSRTGARSAALHLLGEHHEDAAGAADVGQLVHVLVRRHAAQWVAAVPCGDLEGLVDVVDRESHPVHTDLVGPSGLRLDRVGVEVLEELEATVAVRRLEHRDVGVVAVEADGGVGPLSLDRGTADNGQPEIREEGDRRFEVADGDADVLELDGHALQATESVRAVQTT